MIWMAIGLDLRLDHLLDLWWDLWLDHLSDCLHVLKSMRSECKFLENTQ